MTGSASPTPTPTPTSASTDLTGPPNMLSDGILMAAFGTMAITLSSTIGTLVVLVPRALATQHIRPILLIIMAVMLLLCVVNNLSILTAIQSGSVSIFRYYLVHTATFVPSGALYTVAVCHRTVLLITSRPLRRRLTHALHVVCFVLYFVDVVAMWLEIASVQSSGSLERWLLHYTFPTYGLVATALLPLMTVGSLAWSLNHAFRGGGVPLAVAQQHSSGPKPALASTDHHRRQHQWPPQRPAQGDAKKEQERPNRSSALSLRGAPGAAPAPVPPKPVAAAAPVPSEPAALVELLLPAGATSSSASTKAQSHRDAAPPPTAASTLLEHHDTGLAPAPTPIGTIARTSVLGSAQTMSVAPATPAPSSPSKDTSKPSSPSRDTSRGATTRSTSALPRSPSAKEKAARSTPALPRVTIPLAAAGHSTGRLPSGSKSHSTRKLHASMSRLVIASAGALPRAVSSRLHSPTSPPPPPLRPAQRSLSRAYWRLTLAEIVVWGVFLLLFLIPTPAATAWLKASINTVMPALGIVIEASLEWVYRHEHSKLVGAKKPKRATTTETDARQAATSTMSSSEYQTSAEDEPPSSAASSSAGGGGDGDSDGEASSAMTSSSRHRSQQHRRKSSARPPPPSGLKRQRRSWWDAMIGWTTSTGGGDDPAAMTASATARQAAGGSGPALQTFAPSGSTPRPAGGAGGVSKP
ncbi:hypothetical protein H9P43_007463 [Blastocladiella emersonii ATCC 22665]|nr:hypothetical protein H9P43_007463 [Blastocladiella emersonii ATCC 22665]